MEQARKSLPPLSGPRASATANLDPRSDAELSFSILPVSEIVAYGHNPRQGQNPRYDELKASIKADGITNILTVTRRSVDDKYTPYGGGNTRLQIAKELFAEGDQRFAQLRVIVKEWPGDAQVITAHLVENELRADITFWEKAR
ncbi:MAG: ParB N-terminal domain-containing protein, partial [Proteobacteria bacterium]|nr:ParB N-terminal domain-containing protein [Pseudomonadota bacterium]